MKHIITLLLIALSLQAAAQSTQFSAYYYQKKSLFELLPDDQDEIVFLGNSITDGCEWTELLQNPNIKNRGISGDNTYGVLERLEEVTRANPSKIFLLIGINDLSQNISKDTVFSNICLITKQIQTASPKTKIYIQSILPINESFGRYTKLNGKTPDILWINQQLATFCKNQGFHFINLFDAMKTPDDQQLRPELTNDGLHLMGEGYRLWAEIIRPLVQ